MFFVLKSTFGASDCYATARPAVGMSFVARTCPDESCCDIKCQESPRPYRGTVLSFDRAKTLRVSAPQKRADLLSSPETLCVHWPKGLGLWERRQFGTTCNAPRCSLRCTTSSHALTTKPISTVYTNTVEKCCCSACLQTAY